MNLYEILAYGLFVATLLVEAPKFRNVFSEEPYVTTSSKFYDLQTPPSHRLWLFIHLTHTISHMWLVVCRFLEKDWPTYDGFYISHIVFLFIVGFQIFKLAKSPWYIALLINGLLLSILHYCAKYQLYGGYLSVLAVPVLLGVIALIKTQ